MKFKEALIRHSMLSDAVARWTGQKPHLECLEGAWAAATATPDNGSAMASAVRIAIPLDYIPLFRSFDSMPAAYFVICVDEAMTELASQPQELADTLYCANLSTRAIALFEARRAQADTFQEGFGCDRSAAWATLRKCEDQSREVLAKMQKIAKLAGRMFDKMQYEGMPKPSNDPQMVTGVQHGDDIGMMLGEEAATLGVEGLDVDTLSRLEDKQVGQFEMTGEILHGRGPLIIAIDESGSMHDKRQVWSKACAVALARVAMSESRKVRVVHWSTGTYVQDLDPNDDDSIREMAWMHFSGGTNINAAMRLSVAECGELEADGFKGADIVFITDGETQYDEAPFIEMKKQGIQLWTIAIDVNLKGRKQGWNTRGGDDHFLCTYATKYLHINDSQLNDASGAEGLKEAALDNSSREESIDFN